MKKQSQEYNSFPLLDRFLSGIFGCALFPAFFFQPAEATLIRAASAPFGLFFTAPLFELLNNQPPNNGGEICHRCNRQS